MQRDHAARGRLYVLNIEPRALVRRSPSATPPEGAWQFGFLTSKLAAGANRGGLFLFLVRDLDLQEKLMHQNAEISAAIAATLNLRRPEYRDMPQAWRSLCEAAYVASLPEVAQNDFLNRVTTQRGADTALRLREHAASIRANVVRFLDRRKNACMHPSPTASPADAEAC